VIVSVNSEPPQPLATESRYVSCVAEFRRVEHRVGIGNRIYLPIAKFPAVGNIFALAEIGKFNFQVRATAPRVHIKGYRGRRLGDADGLPSCIYAALGRGDGQFDIVIARRGKGNFRVLFVGRSAIVKIPDVILRID